MKTNAPSPPPVCTAVLRGFAGSPMLEQRERPAGGARGARTWPPDPQDMGCRLRTRVLLSRRIRALLLFLEDVLSSSFFHSSEQNADTGNRSVICARRLVHVWAAPPHGGERSRDCGGGRDSHAAPGDGGPAWLWLTGVVGPGEGGFLCFLKKAETPILRGNAPNPELAPFLTDGAG